MEENLLNYYNKYADTIQVLSYEWNLPSISLEYMNLISLEMNSAYKYDDWEETQNQDVETAFCLMTNRIHDIDISKTETTFVTQNNKKHE